MILLLTLWIPNQCSARTPAPYARECKLLDHMATSHDRNLAVAVLKSIALGRAKNVPPEEEASVGLNAGQLRREEFANSTVRVCALGAVARQHSGTREIYWYGEYKQIPFDSKLFAKPAGVKIEEVKQ